jgi:hypothetical protein
MSAPTPDKTEILKALSILYDPDDIVELRIIHNERKRTDAGYFDNDTREKLADYIVKQNPKANIYVTLNPIDPQLHSRYHNRIQEFADSTATDANVTSRRWLLIDCDPIRPKGTSSTDAQLQAAQERVATIKRDLSELGFPEPVVAMSGNGMHLLYRVDMPNTDAARDMLKAFLVWLDTKYNNGIVGIDKTVFNAGRITKLYGTIAKKGDHTANAPHRLSHIVSIPDSIEIINPELVKACIPATETPPPKGNRSTPAHPVPLST